MRENITQYVVLKLNISTSPPGGLGEKEANEFMHTSGIIEDMKELWWEYLPNNMVEIHITVSDVAVIKN